MANNDDTKKLQKALQKKVSTSDTLEPWQEFLERNQTVASAKALQAAEVIETATGSWASSFGYGSVLKTSGSTERLADASVPVPKKQSNSRIGQPGLPEINFPPYDHRTNRGGSRGPALLGHPISFSVVGPTLKSPYTDWQWSFVAGSGSSGDTLTLDIDLDGVAVAEDIGFLYGVSTVPDGGLYLVISQTGAAGDGELNTSGGRAAISPNASYGDLAKFELFRIDDITGQTITLDPNKRVADYFTIPGGTPSIRAITMVKPHVTRLVPLPNSNGVGKERVFVVVPPETSANTDLYPDFTSWQAGLVSDGVTGEADAFSGEFAQPIPVPTTTDAGDSGVFTGELERTDQGAPNSGAGFWRIHQISASAGNLTANDVGKIVHVFETTRDSSEPEDQLVNAPLKTTLGWFEVFSAGFDATFGNFVELKRVPEVNPETGEVFYGPGPYHLNPAATITTVSFTFHKPVSSFFTESELDYDALAAARLQNLIDPTWVKRTTKVDTSLPSGGSPARADRAIFDTSSSGSGLSANPGSLLDLGFRMVLFPATEDFSGNTVPDFDNPITGREVVIDPSITDEQQFIDIDYSAGVVCLSHDPPDVAGGDIIPNGLFTNTNNPNGRVALFAACVPYSMEEGQTGTGVKVTAGDLVSANQGLDQVAQVDAFSRRVVFSVVAGHTIDVRPDNVIDLDVEDTGDTLPATGVLQITDDPSDIFATPVGTFGYTGKTTYAAEGTPSQGSVTVFSAPLTPGDTLTIGGVVLTGVAGARTPGADDFDVTLGTPAAIATEIAAALSDGANSFLGNVLSLAEVSSSDPTFIRLEAAAVGAEGDSTTISTSSGDLVVSLGFSGGVTTRSATRLTGVYTSVALPVTITDGQAILRREPETDYLLDTTYGSAMRSSALRFSFGSIEANADGSFTVTPSGGGGPSEELRANFPLGQPSTSNTPISEVARFHLNDNNRWTAASPPFTAPNANDVGLEVTRGKVVTSAGYNFSDGVFAIRPFVNRVRQLRPLSAVNATPETPSNRWELLVDSGEVSGEVGTGFVPFAPIAEFRSGETGSLCAIVEGGSVSSARDSTWNAGAGLTVGDRFVVNIKDYGNRAVRNSFSDARRDLDEGPSNPVNWFSFRSAGGGGELASDLVTAINAFYTTSTPATESSDGRLVLTERQVQILPSKHFLQSADLTGGVTFDNPCHVSFSLHSADPQHAGRWVTVQVEVTDGASFVDAGGAGVANRVAEFLNNAFYDPAHSGVADVSAAFDNAGFFQVPHGTDPSPNPRLAALTEGERQFVWVGPNDSRHPDGTETVCLMAGGWGSGESSVTAERDFFNVLIEFHPTRETGLTNSDVGTVLGGEFVPATPDTPIRCGLFFGDDADDHNTGGTPRPLVGAFATELVRASANLTMGFPTQGVDPLGGMVGSWPIRSIAAESENYRVTVEIPPGRRPYYSGPQDSVVTTNVIAPQADLQEPFRVSTSETQVKRRAPYLGRWVWSQFQRDTIDLSDGAQAGLSHIWTAYGFHPHEETRFTCHFAGGVSTPQQGYMSYLLYAGAAETDAGQPLVAPDAIQVGDRVFAHDPPAGARSGTETSWEGIVLNTSPDPLDFGGSTREVNFTIMCVGRGFSFNKDYREERTAQPVDFRGGVGTFDPETMGYDEDFALSIVANPNAVTLSSALKFLHSHDSGPSTFQGIFGLLTDAGLEGGSSTSQELPSTTAMLTSGGRVHLLSSLGPNNQAGISLSFPVLGSDASFADTRLATTHIEQGIFTTSVSLGRAGFGTGLEPAGSWDARRFSGTSPLGLFGGHQAGGVGGIRVSGDAHVWLTNIKVLSSDVPTAIVRAVTEAPTDLNFTSTGPSLLMGEASGAGHKPSTFGPARSANGNRPLIHQEATVSIALTQADWRAFQSAIGNAGWPLAPDTVFDPPGSRNDDLPLIMSKSARLNLPMLVPFLDGCYLQLSSESFAVADAQNTANNGMWRIVGAPQVTAAATSQQLGGSTNILSRTYPHTPFATALGTASLFVFGDPHLGSSGHAPASSVIAYLQVRVERFASPHVTTVRDVDETFFTQTVTEANDGHQWTIYADEEGQHPVYVAEVVPPGGSPTGAPNGMRGITINPAVTGSSHGSLPMDVVGLWQGTSGDATEGWSPSGRGRLYGVFETMDTRGRYASMAYFSMDAANPTPPTPPNNAYARMTVYSSQRGDRLDETSHAHTRGEFQVDSAGRVVFVGHPSRLSTGVIMDGGLGLVQATAFRASPRSRTTDTIGSLVVWGHKAGYPLSSHYDEQANTGVQLPSSFNKTEFYDTAVFSGPDGGVHFENAKAAQGLGYNLRELEAVSASWLSPLSLAALRNTTTAVFALEEVDTESVNYPNDTLFPYGSSGIKFRAPGGVVYERAFRPADAQGGNVTLSSLRGKYAEGGIKGMETPAFGEFLLCPKGPPTIHGQGEANFNAATATGRTPLDLPLYEFVNGCNNSLFPEFHASGYFGINPSTIFSSLPVAGDPESGPNSPATSPHAGSPGSLAQSYRHSHSREDGTVYAYQGIMSDAFFDVLEQVRILDGMVIEDVDSGTFYTAGSVGRWKQPLSAVATASRVTERIGQPGDATGLRSSVNGSLTVNGGVFQRNEIDMISNASNGDSVTIDGVTLTAGTEFAVGGTIADTAANLVAAINANISTVFATINANDNENIRLVGQKLGLVDGFFPLTSTNNALVFNLSGGGAWLNGANPEIIYDIGPYTDPLSNVFSDITNGFGDRSDNGVVRRPLTGHRFRITPNVEFVPVLGPLGVDGGLLPPRDSSGDIIPDADAVFYSNGPVTAYEFQKPHDIGRFLYICGTHNYVYTGWWIVIDVIEDYDLDNGVSTTTQNVAVLRKWKRGPENRQPDSTTFDSALPLTDRAPLLRMSADNNFNNSSISPMLFGGTPSDLVLEVADSTGANLYSVVVASATLTGASVTDCDSLATYANSVSTLNGGSVPLTGGPVSNWIVWTSVNNPMYPEGATVEVTYDLSLLDDVQRSEVLGPKAALRIQFNSNTTSGLIEGNAFDHSFVDDRRSIGFYSYDGHNSQIDRASGDRNNALPIGMPATTDPNSGGNYIAPSAARGLRWVFSAPLTEEHVGSYMHLSKPSLTRFGVQLASQDDSANGGVVPDTQAWTSGWPREGDDSDQKGVHTDIYRINRCPNTGHIVLGGDCEVYFPEIIDVQSVTGDSGKGRPILYSPLGIMGVWPDTDTGLTPSGGHHNDTYRYALQPIARERIVTVSPRSGLSNTLMGHSGNNPAEGLLASSGDTYGTFGPDGLSPAIVGRDPETGQKLQDSSPADISNWWVLKNRHDATRTRIAENRSAGTGWGFQQHTFDFGDQTGLNNSNSPAPVNTAGALPDSTYTWTPAGEYWYLNVPAAVRQSWQYDASQPPPTLMVDLTEYFTQAMQPGGGINSPYPGKAPKGARLTRLWVNFGLWGNELASKSKDDLPGYEPGTNENDVLKHYAMTFNLVLEIPGSQARQLGANNHPLGAGTSGLPFGDRAPTASYNHPGNGLTGDRYPGGTIVVPLYVNREAGDLMPNVMERWVSAGPTPAYNSSVLTLTDPTPDWLMGDYEFGFGCGGDGANPTELHLESGFFSNSHNPVLWGGIDTATAINGGPFTSPGFSRVLATPFARSSRVSGGVRSAFTSGILPDGDAIKRTDPDSLSAAAMTGITITHAATFPRPEPGIAGALRHVVGFPAAHAGRHTGHAFTMALTPVGDIFEPPNDGAGSLQAVNPTTPPTDGSETLALHGRTLDADNALVGTYDQEYFSRRFKVGNWLDNILNVYGINAPSGSMLPPGARVFLEVTAMPGPQALPSFHPDATDPEESGSGCWVGGIRLAFDVETADGTAYTTNVNALGEDGS